MKRTGYSYRSFFSFVFLVFLAEHLFWGRGAVKICSAREFSLPASVMLCDEKIDLSNEYNRRMFDREFTIVVWDASQVFMWLKRAGRFFPFFEKRLKEEGLPDDLKYMAVAESSLHTHVKSSEGALGIWQLMPFTARGFGLRVEKGVIDERLCFERSTEAALSYLKYLKKRFGNWSLAMAGYNCGEGRLYTAMKKQNTTSFFSLDLPRETERYIFRIAAVKEVMANPQKYGYQPDPSRFWQPLSYEKHELEFQSSCSLFELVENTAMDYKEFTTLNPGILGSYLPQGRYYINVLPDKSAALRDYLNKRRNNTLLKNEKKNWRYYVVKSGDALFHISRRTGVPVENIKKMNGLKNSIIRPGQKLLINP